MKNYRALLLSMCVLTVPALSADTVVKYTTDECVPPAAAVIALDGQHDGCEWDELVHENAATDDNEDLFDETHRSLHEAEAPIDPPSRDDAEGQQDPLLSLLYNLADEEQKREQKKPPQEPTIDTVQSDKTSSALDQLLADMLKNTGKDGLGVSPLLPQADEKKDEVQVTFKMPTKMISHYAGRLPQKLKDLINVTRIRNQMTAAGHENFSNQGRFVVLYGPPGTGKTTLSQIIAAETGSLYFAIHAGQLLNKFYGESVKQLNGVFAAAHEQKKAVVIFIDEVDEILGSFEQQDKVRKELRSALNKAVDALVDLDSKQNEHFNPRVVVIVATNHYEDIAANSKTRARNWCVEVPLPTCKSRKAIIQRYLQKYHLPVKNSVISKLAKKTEGWSGRELEKMVEHSFVISLRNSATGNMIQPTVKDLLKAFKDTEREIRIEKKKEEDRTPMIDTKRPWVNVGQMCTSLATTGIIGIASWMVGKATYQKGFFDPLAIPVRK